MVQRMVDAGAGPHDTSGVARGVRGGPALGPTRTGLAPDGRFQFREEPLVPVPTVRSSEMEPLALIVVQRPLRFTGLTCDDGDGVRHLAKTVEQHEPFRPSLYERNRVTIYMADIRLDLLLPCERDGGGGGPTWRDDVTRIVCR